jgi:hypothetical protein
MRYCWCVDCREKVRTAGSFARSDYREVGKRQQEESDYCRAKQWWQPTRLSGKLVAD